MLTAYTQLLQWLSLSTTKGNKTMTIQQIKWAKQHDWFVSALNGTVVAIDAYTKDGEYFESTVRFTDFRELYNWAAY
jgi:hypothetical protein